MKKSVIITSYMDEPIDFKTLDLSERYVICTDGGYDIAVDNGVKTDLLLGDFDSIENRLPDDIEIERFKPEKDYTDLDLALSTAARDGFSDVLILGGIGGRLDHTMANVQLLSHYDPEFEKLVMMDGMNKCFILDPKKRSKITLPKEKNSYFSVFSLSEECTGVTIADAKYNVKDHTFTRTFPLGVSNEFAKENTVISIEDGILLIVISKM